MSNNKIPSQPTFTFERENYILMIVGLVVLAIGYALMAGGGSDDPNVFSEEIFDTQRLTVAPLVILAGFGIEIAAILYKPKRK
jgi:hypothetical protein